ncbi:hypothetical protein [Streptomyces sp. NPDC046909]|uniref:hypothetical protein n=1 Tax=Streptomyces sp. NPDC046909 TaxID=3155617 RepID=UPI0033D6D789
MTDTPHTPRTPPPTAPGQALRPFARDPRRWQKEQFRVLRIGHVCPDAGCAGRCEPALVYERTGWGWLAWTVPDDGSLPELPQQIGVITPGAPLRQRLAVRRLTRRPAHRIALTEQNPASVRPSAAWVAAISLFAAVFAVSRGIPAGLVLPLMLLAPLLAEHLPDRLDDRARTHVRSVEGDAACRYLKRLAALHTFLAQTAADSDRYELRRSAEIGHHLLWDAAGLLQSHETRTVSARLIDQERLMVQLADQVTQILDRTRAESAPSQTDRPRGGDGPLGPLPPGFEPASQPTHASAPGTSPKKGPRPMPHTPTDRPARTTDTYLLFAHEPYYPDTGTQEINTTVVAANTLLHPHLRQPDGARIHDLLTRGRTPGEIIPLSTLTHELDGGAGWPQVGDWERVTHDLVYLVRTGECDALSLGLPEIARALLCAGPNSRVRAVDAAGQVITYGPQERAAVLAEADLFLTGLVTEQKFWPGDDLLPPLHHPA